MSRPRPLAASSLLTAHGVNASAPMPYTVSVGRTTSSPFCTAVTAAAIPASRCSGSEQSYRSLIAAYPVIRRLARPATWR